MPAVGCLEGRSTFVDVAATRCDDGAMDQVSRSTAAREGLWRPSGPHWTRPASIAPLCDRPTSLRSTSSTSVAVRPLWKSSRPLSLTPDSHATRPRQRTGWACTDARRGGWVHGHWRRPHTRVLRGRDGTLGVDRPVRPHPLPGRRCDHHRSFPTRPGTRALTVHVAMNISRQASPVRRRVSSAPTRRQVRRLRRRAGRGRRRPLPGAVGQRLLDELPRHPGGHARFAHGGRFRSHLGSRLVGREPCCGSKRCAPGSNETGHHPLPSRFSSAMRLDR